MGYIMGLIAVAALVWALVERRRTDTATFKAALEKKRGDTLDTAMGFEWKNTYRMGELTAFLRDFIAHPHSREHLAKAKELLERGDA